MTGESSYRNDIRAGAPASGRWRTAMAHGRWPWVVGVVAILFALPSLRAGWLMDDHYHRLQIIGSERYGDWLKSPWDLFRFLDGDPVRTHRLMDMGVIPWWTSNDAKAAFFRPVTTLTHRIDYWLWPQSPVPIHLQSVLWYGLGAVAVALLYRRVLGAGWVAGLAALMFAMDDAHGTPIGFLANRNALVALVFGATALLAHDRWRREHWRPGAILGPILLAIALLSAEAGLATTAYLFAYAVFLDNGSARSRIVSLLPYVAVSVVWRLAWTIGDYGAVGIGLYIDPLGEPTRYLSAMVRRLPILLLSQWTGVAAEVHGFLPVRLQNILLAMAVIVILVIAIVLGKVLRGDKRAAFWATGMILALLPGCATFPMDRLLLFGGIGAFGLIAQLFGAAWQGQSADDQPARLPIAARVLVWGFVAAHVIFAPLALIYRSAMPMGPERLVEQLRFRAELPPEVTDQDLIVVNAPSPIYVGYVPILAELNNTPVPARTRVLAPAFPAVTIRRPDDRTLIIRPEHGFLYWSFDRLFRAESRPMVMGQQIGLTNMVVTITEVNGNGDPLEAEFTFARPLDDRCFRWMQWRAGHFVPFEVPAVGQSVELRPDRPRLRD